MQNLCPDKFSALLSKQCHHTKTMPSPGHTGDQGFSVMFEFVLMLVQSKNEAN